MTVGIKTTELPQAVSLKPASALIGIVDDATSRVPLTAAPELLREIVFLTANQTVNLNEEQHLKRFLNVNNSEADVAMTLPDITSVLATHGSVSRGGLFCEGVVGSGNYDVSITATIAGQLRTSSPNFQPTLTADTIYLGSRRALADETYFAIHKRGGLWVVQCMGGVRSLADVKEGLISTSDLSVEIDVDSTQDRVLTDDDHKRPVWLTNNTPGNVTFQSDIAEGIEITVVNDGSSAAVFNPGDHTIVGDTAVSAGQAATIITGPVVTGITRRIFIAASA